MIALKNKSINKEIKNLIFDTNIFIMGIDFNVIDATIYTIPKVIEEIKHEKYINKNRNILNRIQVAIESKKLIIKIPSEKYIQTIEMLSKITGDYNALSLTDRELLALNLELKDNLNEEVMMITNDYSMENVCLELNIPFSPLIREGIKSKIIWEVYCPFCKESKSVEQFGENCEKCGIKLKRIRKNKIN
jgi:UPF0271 protein